MLPQAARPPVAQSPAAVRTSCAGCGGGLRDFLDLGASPLADRFPATPDTAETWYRLQVAICTGCWLAQLRDVVPGAELYGADYGFSTGTSPSAARYFASWAEWAMARYGAQARRGTVEIACNDGTLLRWFARAGCPVLGVDPAGPAAGAARYAPVTAEPFTAELAGRIGHGRAGLVIACNVAAHVDDPADFLAGVAALLDPGGVAVAEFQNLADLIAGCQFDHVYHEHRFFYSLRSFARLAAGAGLAVMDWERTPAQGGSLRVTMRRQDGGLPQAVDPWLETITPYAGMQARADYARRRLLDLVLAEREAGRVVAGYAASAKSATLLTFCGIGADLLPWVEDTTPGKIGRYTPGSHIPVVAPGDRGRPDDYLLLAWNYLTGVLARERAFTDAGGRFLVPGPVPVII